MSQPRRRPGRPPKSAAPIVYSPAEVSAALFHTSGLFDTPHVRTPTRPVFFRVKPATRAGLAYKFTTDNTMMHDFPMTTPCAQLIDMTTARMIARPLLLSESNAAAAQIRAAAASSSSSSSAPPKRRSDGEEPAAKRPVALLDVEVVERVLARVSREFDAAFSKNEEAAVKTHAVDCFLLQTMCSQLLERPPDSAPALDLMMRISSWIDRYRLASDAVTVRMSEKEAIDYKRDVENRRDTAEHLLSGMTRRMNAALKVTEKDLATLDALGKLDEKLAAQVVRAHALRVAITEFTSPK